MFEYPQQRLEPMGTVGVKYHLLNKTSMISNLIILLEKAAKNLYFV